MIALSDLRTNTNNTITYTRFFFAGRDHCNKMVALQCEWDNKQTIISLKEEMGRQVTSSQTLAHVEQIPLIVR